MSWRETLAESLGYPQPEPRKLKSRVRTPIDNIDAIDTNKARDSSVNIVNFVERVPRSTFSAEAPRVIPPELTPTECQEVRNWPPETQRVFVAVLDHMETRGFLLSKAEALAFAVMQELAKRKGGLVRFADNKMPVDMAGVIASVKDVFGGGVSAEWVPASAPTTRGRDNLVHCCECQHFLPGTGDAQHGLGSCLGDAWDKNRGQWPQAQHQCAGYTAKGDINENDN